MEINYCCQPEESTNLSIAGNGRNVDLKVRLAILVGRHSLADLRIRIGKSAVGAFGGGALIACTQIDKAVRFEDDA